MAENPNPKVFAYNVAISDETGFKDFFEPDGHLTNGSLIQNFAGIFSNSLLVSPTVTIAGQELSALLQSYSRILLKIDVEGAEFNVLSSLQTLISTQKPDIIMEVLPVFAQKLSELKFLTEEYDLFSITELGLQPRTAFDANLMYRDYFLRPKSSNRDLAQ